jgi:hypothetical protein
VRKPTKPASDSIVEFLRKRDYRLIRELGRGACGRTVLIHDDTIDEDFVCKKYSPYSEEHRQELFDGFLREIKLLHKVHHPNLVRVFNYYVYPDRYAGYILMEYISGTDVEDYLASRPEQINEVFLQSIEGFQYLEGQRILHRDVRPQNLMVRDDGVVKIIDLGFGKRINDSKDFDKSITLNWWCETPEDFDQSVYDFATEVYFVGKLFEQVILENSIEHFAYGEILRRMCQRDPATRVKTFGEVQRHIDGNRFFEVEFAFDERRAYQEFADNMQHHVTQIESGTKYVADPDGLVVALENAYRKFMLEQVVPDAAIVLRCFLNGQYYLRRQGFPVAAVSDFLRLLKTAGHEKRRIILGNLHTRLDAIKRYVQEAGEDDMPF